MSETESVDSSGSQCPKITGACSASEASVQHLWTEQHPTCYQISAVCFSTEAPGLPCSLSPRPARFMRKTPLSSSHLPPVLKELCGLSGVDLLPGTSSDLDTARPASLNIVNLIPYLRAQKLLASCKTHRRFIIPSLFALTKH